MEILLPFSRRRPSEAIIQPNQIHNVKNEPIRDQPQHNIHNNEPKRPGLLNYNLPNFFESFRRNNDEVQQDHPMNQSFRNIPSGNNSQRSGRNSNQQLPIPDSIPPHLSNPDDFEGFYREDMSGSSPLQRVLDELNMSILPHDVRLSAVMKANQILEHRDRLKHDYELHEGAARILYQKLAFVLTLCIETSDAVNEESFIDSGVGNYNTKNMNTQSQAHVHGVHASSTSDEEGSQPSQISSDTMPTFTQSMPLNVPGITHNSYDSRMYAAVPNSNLNSSNHGENTNAASMQRMRSTRSSAASDADYEIALLTSCLECVHRANPEAIAYTWQEMGVDAIKILVRLLERPFEKMKHVVDYANKFNHSSNVVERNLATAINRENKLSVQKITKILAVYSLIPEAKVAMANTPGLLAVLVKITDTQNLNRMKTARPVSKRLSANHVSNAESNSFQGPNQSMLGANGIQGTAAGAGLYMTEAARFNAIAVLTNLAAVEQNRMLMLSEPGLVDNIARVVHNERSDVARQCSSLAIMNLSNGDREHVPELAGNDLILETLIKLMMDDDLETRRNAAISLFNVACADENTVKLVRYKDGIILEVLKECLSVDEDDTNDINNDVRTNVAEALFNMSCSSIEETTDRMANYPGLLETLAFTLRSQMGCKEVKLYCAATLRRFAEIIHSPQRAQLELLSALVKASVWTKTSCIAEAFLYQAQLEHNRNAMVHQNGLLNAMSKMALSIGGAESDKIRAITVSAIEHLSREVTTREVLSQHEGIMLAMTRASYLGKTDPNQSNSNHSLGNDDMDSVDGTSSVASTNRKIQLALKRLVGAM